MLSGSCEVTAPGEYGIAGAVQGQHFCNLEWDDNHARHHEPNAPLASDAELRAG
jgi:hypothetical protein